MSKVKGVDSNVEDLSGNSVVCSVSGETCNVVLCRLGLVESLLCPPLGA